ncbi:DNA-binding transcriptional LysR family regulator [Frondihabitans sp. PhB188]|uniref:LysR family transcriptional regulator n=1 Tax=Frondihabitans sp. PhB188 TaxID=2485200 RepID=UPI000F46D3DC|nr:LysR family transcriptional regulator [Frondihabitans sp. PhB188]ROQ37249.1 DNA-binding transcriptional LysR family regulator [Frondihabitans sp. PhB188]
MDDLETRELRYFVAVAERLHFGRAASDLGIAQPALSRAIQQIEQRVGVPLLDRDRRGVRLTAAGEVLLREARTALDGVSAAVRRARRAGAPVRKVVLATKAGSSHEFLQALLDANAADKSAAPIEVMLCEIGEQQGLLLDGSADAAILHRPFDDFAGIEGDDLDTEAQVAIVPASHPLASRLSLTMVEVTHVPGLPMARWPLVGGGYADGPGPEVHSQSQLAQLVALGQTLLVIPRSSRAWQWPEHVAVPVLDAPLATTVFGWPTGRLTPDVARLRATALRVHESAALTA